MAHIVAQDFCFLFAFVQDLNFFCPLFGNNSDKLFSLLRFGFLFIFFIIDRAEKQKNNAKKKRKKFGRNSVVFRQKIAVNSGYIIKNVIYRRNRSENQNAFEILLKNFREIRCNKFNCNKTGKNQGKNFRGCFNSKRFEEIIYRKPDPVCRLAAKIGGKNGE